MAKHNVFVSATPLSGVAGRVDYISNPKRQEHLEAVYSSTDDPGFWHALAKHCQDQAKYSKSKHACEGREFMIKLANDLYKLYSPDFLAQRVSELLKEETGTENIVAVHWNKSHKSYHLHVVCAENPEINEVTYGAVLTRNTYYNAEGKRSDKKDCVDPETKELLPGCELLKKGERKVIVKRFGSKNEEMSSKHFLMTLKQKAAELQNELLNENRFKVFEHDGLHLAEQPVGKGKPENIENAIKAKNVLVREYNFVLDRILETVERNEPETKSAAINELKKNRNTLKRFAGTDKWNHVLQLCLEASRKFLAGINLYLKRRKERQKINLESQIKAAETELAGQNVEKAEPAAKVGPVR